MVRTIKISKGLDIKLIGEAKREVVGEVISQNYAVKPIDFENFKPKLVLKEGNPVKRGETIFYDKYNPDVCFASPVSGQIKAVVRGEKRKILEIQIESDGKDECIKADIADFFNLTKEEKVKLMLKHGLWPFIKQRPYGIIANQNDVPRDIFISFIDSAPLSADLDFILKDKKDEINSALKFISELTDGNVYLSFKEGSQILNLIDNKENYKINYFKGPHPAGLVGVQINKLKPINKSDIIWTVNASDLPIIGKFIQTGEYLPERIIAMAGSEISNPSYYKCISGCDVKEAVKNNTNGENLRIISGNVLTGKNISQNGFLGFYDTGITVIPEGDKYEFMGWAAPGFNKLSRSATFMSKLFPNKKFKPDTNLNGGQRAYVVTGEYESVCPMDIYPQLLIKAIMANDIDKMEQLGIYEIIEEDFALCEFICTSKIDVQEIVRKGLNEMIKEMS